MNRLLRQRLKSKKGETLIETLASLLVIALGMTTLAGAIVTTARLNHDAEANATQTIRYDASGGGSAKVNQISSDTNEVTVKVGESKIKVNLYETEQEGNSGKHLYYYEYANKENTGEN